MAISIKLKRKMYTQWDETDNLKRMKDADILAEKKRTTTDYGNIARTAALGGATVGAAGMVAGGIKGGMKPATVGAANMASGITKGMGKFGKLGLAAGAIGGATLAYAKGRKKAEENEFYNKRLQYAQKQAVRREKKDWKTNMTQRDGYSY